MSSEWNRVRAVVQILSEDYGNDFIVIGGVGVYLHARQSDVLPEEFTHDVDAFVTAAAYSEMRDVYEVVMNRRLSKAQITVDGIEVDLYPEHQNRLRFDFGELAFHAEEIEGIHVASLEHLLFLKLTAAGDRWNSSHGAKDRRDVAKILVLLDDVAPKIGIAAVTEIDLQLLDAVLQSTAFMELAKRNAKQAKDLRQLATHYVRALRG